LIDAAERIEAVQPEAVGIQVAVGDKGYHSSQSLVDLEAVSARSYVPEPDRGRRNWKKNPHARDAMNRRRIRSPRGQRYYGSAVRDWSVPLLISVTPVACAASTFAGTSTF